MSYKTFIPDPDPRKGDGKFKNQKNEIWFAAPSEVAQITEGVLGYTNIPPTTWGYITEADVVFNKDYLSKFEFSQNKNKLHIWKLDSDGKYSFMAVAMHELGHVAGALHEGGLPNLMGIVHAGKRSDDSTSGYHVPGSMGVDIQTNKAIELAIPLAGADFANGMTNAYGIDSDNKKENVSVSPWKYNGKEPDCDPTVDDKCSPLYYSLHSRKTLLYDAAGNQITPVASTADPKYMRSDPLYGNIIKNTTYQAAFLYENTGKSPALNVNWRAYVSTDDVLDIATDRSLAAGSTGEGNFTIDRKSATGGGPMSEFLKFKLPTDLANNTVYYVFIVLDPDNLIPEENEQDNFTYVEIRTAS